MQSVAWEVSVPSRISPAFYGAGGFITVFTAAHHLSLSWAQWGHSAPRYPFSLRYSLTLCSHLRLGLHGVYILVGSSLKLFVSTIPLACYVPDTSHPPRFGELASPTYLSMIPVKSVDYINHVLTTAAQWFGAEWNVGFLWTWLH